MFVFASAVIAAPPALSASGSVTHYTLGTGEPVELFPSAPGANSVIGGVRAEIGDWPDAVGVVLDGFIGCTGTLVAPDVVITAAHCAGGISHVLVGSTNINSNQGELIQVLETHVHPSYDGFRGLDLAALKLRNNSSFPHRVIANDCVLDEDLFDGAAVSIVGFGATDQDGFVFTNFQMVGEATVRDHDCSQNRLGGILTGCDPDLRPGGEIIAGGDGVDACAGDSGGPLYLHTPRGVFVVGVTSRAMAGVDFFCGQGGIWARPDRGIAFIQNRMNVTLERPLCNFAPIAVAAPLEVRQGDSRIADLVVDDPDGVEFTVEIVAESSLGTTTITDGEVVFTAFGDAEGSETVMLRVTDEGNPQYENGPPLSVEVPLEVTVTKRGCGCSASGTSSGVVLLAGLLAILGVRRKTCG